MEASSIIIYIVMNTAMTVGKFFLLLVVSVWTKEVSFSALAVVMLVAHLIVGVSRLVTFVASSSSNLVLLSCSMKIFTFVN